VVSGKKVVAHRAEAMEAVNEFRNQIQAKRGEQQKMMQEKKQRSRHEKQKRRRRFPSRKQEKRRLEDHLQRAAYKILTQGKGKIPTSNDTVIAHYPRDVDHGTEFDSSYKRGEPVPFGVTRVIKGWTEALLMMPVGSKWQLAIPSELAYGENGRPGIPPNSVLLSISN